MQIKTVLSSLLVLCATLLMLGCTQAPQIVEKPVTIQKSLAPLSGPAAEARDTNFQSRMMEFVKNKDGKYRFSQRDTEWLLLFSGEADNVVIQVQSLQTQAANDRAYINTPLKTTDSNTTK